MLALQVSNGMLDSLSVADRRLLDLRLHPVIDLLVEHRQAAGEKDGKQQPAEQQATPGVQPGHGLSQGLFHARRSSRCGQKPISASGAAAGTTTQARQALRAANAQRIARV